MVNSKFISTDGDIKKQSNEQYFPLFSGDIVMVMSDVPNGKALAKTLLIDSDNKYSLNQRICCIRSNNYLPEFLKIFLDRHPSLLAFNNGENQTNLRKNDILNCPIPDISKNEQIIALENFDKVNTSLEETKEIFNLKLSRLFELKQKILVQELGIE